MIWLWECAILLAVGLALRRVLHMGGGKPPANALTRRRPRRIEPLYSPLASEVEAHGTILGVSLNDAFEEEKSGHPDAARCMVSIFASECKRLTEFVEGLQHLALRYLPMVELPLPVRNLDANRFRSGNMVEFVRFHAFVDQFVFRPKLRFQLRLRLQRRAIAMLSEEFNRIQGSMEEGSEPLTQALPRLDLYFHDLDLLAKESLLAFRAELSCLPEEALADIEVELQELVSEGVVKPQVLVNQ